MAPHSGVSLENGRQLAAQVGELLVREAPAHSTHGDEPEGVGKGGEETECRANNTSSMANRSGTSISPPLSLYSTRLMDQPPYIYGLKAPKI